jgi:hypothetical protein
MQENLSIKFKQFFLTEFTKELIRTSQPIYIFKIKEILKEKYPSEKEPIKKLNKFEIKKQVSEVLNVKSSKKESIREPLKNFENRRNFIVPRNRVKNKLPSQFNSLAPVYSEEKIDLGKLNPFIFDSKVNLIESNGPDTNIFVNGSMGRKKTKVVLNSEEINFVVNNFLKKSKIPRAEGVVNVVFGNLILTASISENVASVFSIKKIPKAPLKVPSPSFNATVPRPPSRRNSGVPKPGY